jgi:hypothetical protein
MERAAVENVSGRYGRGTESSAEVAGIAVSETDALAAPPQARDALLEQLLLLNALLQVFDGVATYAGLQHGVREANPLLRSAFHLWGVVPTLLVFKASAFGLLVFVYRFASQSLATPALAALAAVYAVCSLAPWLSMFLRLLSSSF